MLNLPGQESLDALGRAQPQRVAQHLLRHGYEGVVYPVNPKRQNVLGIRAYPTIGDIPDRLKGRVPDRFEVRYVSRNGGIRWNNGWINVSTVCIGEYVGLEEIDDRGLTEGIQRIPPGASGPDQ